jgi:hypothetical protein
MARPGQAQTSPVRTPPGPCWIPGGVTAEAGFTGGLLLHLAAAGCVLRDLYREAAARAIGLGRVQVTAAAGFDAATWQSGTSVTPAGHLSRRGEVM